MVLLLPALDVTAAERRGRLTASLDPPVIEFGAQSTLELRFEDCVPQTVPEIPAVAGLQIRYGGQGRQTTIVNGSMQSAVVFSYLVQPSQPGTYTIPSLRTVVDGQVLASEPVTLQVVQSDAQASQVPPLILTLELSKGSFYVGEATTATVSLFSRYASQRLLQLPALSVDGAIVGTNVPVAAPQTVTTNNAVYRLERWQVPVTFVKTGDLRVSAEDCQVAVQVRSQRTRDPFGFPSLFGEVETRRFPVSSLPVSVRVRPLPADNVPPEFSGAVGQFALDAAVSSTNVSVGDPITVSVRLSGRGNLDSLRWSAPSDWSGFRVYEPTSRLEVGDALGQTGVRTVEQVVVPDSPALQAIPPIRFAFFDPTREAYQTLRHPGFPLSVTAATAPSAQPTVTRSSNPEENQRAADIVHIKNRPGHLAVSGPPLIARPGFVALALVPLLAWGISRWARRRVERRAADPRQARCREVGRRLRAGLTVLRARMQAGQVEGFHSELFRLLQEVLGERLDLPAASITGEIVDRRLRALQVPADLADSVERLFTQCDQARYAPEAAIGTLEATLSEAERTLRQLQHLEVNRER